MELDGISGSEEILLQANTNEAIRLSQSPCLGY
jgi:hypothetical protein